MPCQLLWIKVSVKCIHVDLLSAFIITVSGDDGSDSWSVGSSAYGSSRSRSGADPIFVSSHFRYSSHTSYESGAIKRYNSMEFPPPNSECFVLALSVYFGLPVTFFFTALELMFSMNKFK